MSSIKEKDEIKTRTVTFAASDGWQLTGELFSANKPSIAVLVSAGTGFPRRFYKHIAAHFAQKGALVLTYDYRGIGDSYGTKEDFLEIDYQDWGRYDMTAAVEKLETEADGLPIVHVAHSVGGHFWGLVENHHKIKRHAFVSVGTGYWGGHHKRYLPLEIYFWWGMGTYSLMRHGFIDQSGGWSGEPLPPKLFRQWRKWSHRRSYFAPEITTSFVPCHYESVTAPIRSWIFSDDPIATPCSSKDLLQCYPNAPSEILERSPADYGLSRIGHEGAFRSGRERLWDDIWSWVEPEKI